MQTSSPARRTREDRARVLLGLVFAGFALVTIGLLVLQVVRHEEYVELSKENRVRLEILRAPRGSIYDRHGELLADTAPSFSIVFRPAPAESTKHKGTAPELGWLRRVASLVELDTAEVRARVRLANRSGQTAMLRRDASFGVRAGVEEEKPDLPGIDVQMEPIRHYLNGSLGAHLLGYAGEVNQQELEKRAERGYRLGDLIGRTGVESAYEDILRGTDGAEYVVVNAAGRRVSTLTEGPPLLPRRGHDVVLTLDLKVQRALEEAMADVERGAAVAIDPRDGGILGLVSRPSFDPNEFSHGLTWARWKQLSEGGANPLLNRAIQGVYPPGSTFKTVTMTAALETGIATPGSHQATACNGGYAFGGRVFGCWDHRGHGSLDFVDAIAHSCDVYFYQIGLKLGLDPLEHTAREYGFGLKTGIDLPQERRGLVPSTAYYDRVWGAGRWRRGLLLNLAIGQGELLVTPLQLALMMAEVANNGRAVRPHLVKEVRGVPTFHPDKPSQSGVEVRPAVWQAVKEGLERVVSSGTGGGAKVPGVRVAGKTGTAQNPHGKDHALFAGFAPVDDPWIALAVVVENSGHGGSIAAPRAGRILRALFVPDTAQVAPVPIPVDTAAVAD